MEKNSAIVLEGQLDLITAYEAGIKHVVASQGTAFNEKQAGILKRLADEVVLCFDADSAGEKATGRSVLTLLDINLFVKIARVPAGHDPDSLIRDKGPGEFTNIIASAADFFDFQLSQITAQGEMTVRKKMEAGRKMAGFVGHITEPLFRETIASRVAAQLGLSREDFQKALATSKPHRAEREGTVEPEVPKPGNTIWVLSILALRNKEARQWLLQQNWRQLLEQTADGKLLELILGGAVDPDSPASISSFLAGLPPGEQGLVSRLLVERVPAPELLAQAYWTSLEVDNFRKQEIAAQRMLAKAVEPIRIRDLHLALLSARRETVEAQLRTPGLRVEQRASLAKQLDEILALEKAGGITDSANR